MWVTRLSAAEKAYFDKQPTAQKMHEKMLKDGVYIPAGDKEAAAAFVAKRDAEKTAAASDVELSTAGKSLQADAAKADTAKGAAAKADSAEQVTVSTTDVQFLGEGASRKLRFTSAEALHQAVKDGCVELGGQQYFLSDDMMRTLSAKDKAMQKLQQGIAQANMLRQQAVSAQRQGESMQKSAQAQSRLFETAMRIMHGRKVSTADEKELASAAPELYRMAKSMSGLEQHKLTRKEKEEDDKISQKNDEDREWEQSPSSIPDAVDTPVPEYSVDVDLPETSVDIEA
ncbi:MAG: hypothetical protein SPL39_08855 [Selenomonadaceae bacterium]|nr:hypothetical protein [Selenomonadaceae bacterium]